MKRATFVLLLIIMVITMFVACGKEETDFKKMVNQVEEDMYASTELKEIMGEPIGILGPISGTEWWLYESDEGEAAIITVEFIDALHTVTEIDYRNSEVWKEYSESEVGQKFLSGFTFYK